MAKTLAKKSAPAAKKTSTTKKSAPAKKAASKKVAPKSVDAKKAAPKKVAAPKKKTSSSSKAKTSKKAPIDVVNEVAKKAKPALPPTKKADKVKKTATNKGVRAKLSQEGDAERLLSAVIDGLQDMKAVNIVSIDLRKIEDAVANYFVICEGEATTHIKGIANNVEDKVMKAVGEKPWHIEGMENLEWVVVDYVNVVLHIFRKESRLFYQLEDLWTDGVRTEY